MMLSNLKKYINQVLQDTSGHYSSKRFVTLLSVVLMTVGFFANLFGDYTIDKFIYESVMYIVIAGLGFSGAECFAPRKNEVVE